MRACMCVCARVCMRVSMCVCTSVHTYLCACLYACVCVHAGAVHLCLVSGLKLAESQGSCSLRVQTPNQSFDQPGMEERHRGTELRHHNQPQLV